MNPLSARQSIEPAFLAFAINNVEPSLKIPPVSGSKAPILLFNLVLLARTYFS